jgi:hypothetical protein
MILVDNISLVKSNNPKLWDKIKQYENSDSKSSIFLTENTGMGSKTLYLQKDEKKIYFHSKYNPLREAETIVQSYDNIKNNSGVIFYGTGLGYHIEIILSKYSNISYYIYEPNIEVFYNFLSSVNLAKFRSARLMGISTSLKSLGREIGKFIDLYKEKLIIVELPSHRQIFPQENIEFNKRLAEIIKGKRRTMATEYSFQKRWITNSMENFKTVLSTPNIILNKKGRFTNIPVILAAAGPSLNDDIVNIRHIKEKKLAYIISVGSAINTLLYHNIYPDAVTSYDPTAANQMVFAKVKEAGINKIPMIFGTSIGCETLNSYPGKKYHMITSQDTVAAYYLKSENFEVLDIVRDAPSIAVVTLQLLYYMGFNPIILAGQNFAFRDKKRHSDGVYYSKELTDSEMEKRIMVKDVYGNEILTNEIFNSMRFQMERFIKMTSGIEVINTTRGGAKIEGTEFIELDKLIEDRLREKVVEENWLEMDETRYDAEYLYDRMKTMNKEYEEAKRITKNYKSVLEKIRKLMKTRNLQELERTYVKLDEQLNKIEKNDFYRTFILPMNRVEYKLLTDNIDDFNKEKDPFRKAERVLKAFGDFITICSHDIEVVKPIYDRMNEAVMEYCGGIAK